MSSPSPRRSTAGRLRRRAHQELASRRIIASFSSRKSGSSYPYRLWTPASGPRPYDSRTMSRHLSRHPQPWMRLHPKCTCSSAEHHSFEQDRLVIVAGHCVLLTLAGRRLRTRKRPGKLPGPRFPLGPELNSPCRPCRPCLHRALPASRRPSSAFRPPWLPW